MSNIDKQTLRRAAMWIRDEKWVHAGKGEVISEEYVANGETLVDHICNCEVVGTSSLRAEFIAAANPATVLALLDELEAKDNRINRLEAIVAVAEQRNALMREWKRALKVPCDLVDDQVPVVIHGMVIRLERQSGIIQSARKFISEYAGLGDVGAAEFIKIIDRAAAGNGE